MTELRVEPYELPTADLGPENPLPYFRGREDHSAVGMAPSLPDEDRRAFLDSLGLESAGLDRLIRAGYHLLGLQTYFTAGEPEVRAWTIHRGDTAPVAAGGRNTDHAKSLGFEQSFRLVHGHAPASRSEF